LQIYHGESDRLGLVNYQRYICEKLAAVQSMVIELFIEQADPRLSGETYAM